MHVNSAVKKFGVTSFDRKIHFFASCIMYYTFIFCIIHNTCRFNNTFLPKMYYTFIFCIIQFSKMYYTKYIFGFSISQHRNFRTSNTSLKHENRVTSPSYVDFAFQKLKNDTKMWFSRNQISPRKKTPRPDSSAAMKYTQF